MKKLFLALVATGVLLAQYGSYTNYSGDDHLNTVLSLNTMSRRVGNQAVCVSTPTPIPPAGPVAGLTLGYYLSQWCACPGGCAVIGIADQMNQPGALLGQSMDAFTPDFSWEQDYGATWESCQMLSVGIAWDWFITPWASTCTG